MSKHGKSGKSTRFVSGYTLSRADAQKFAKDANTFVKKATSSKKVARETLSSMGTHTPTGRLAKRYA